MLTDEQIKQIEDGVVERHRQLYSDDRLWAMLDERETSMAQLSKTMASYSVLVSLDDDYRVWQNEIKRLARRYSAHLEFADVVLWHLERRGLVNAAKWHEGWRDFNQASALSWQQEPWAIN